MDVKQFFIEDKSNKNYNPLPHPDHIIIQKYNILIKFSFKKNMIFFLSILYSYSIIVYFPLSLSLTSPFSFSSLTPFPFFCSSLPIFPSPLPHFFPILFSLFLDTTTHLPSYLQSSLIYLSMSSTTSANKYRKEGNRRRKKRGREKQTERGKHCVLQSSLSTSQQCLSKFMCTIIINKYIYGKTYPLEYVSN